MDRHPVLLDLAEHGAVEYIYTPLERGEFRILGLHPGVCSDDLMCTLFTEGLGCPKFAAVSYCWGSTNRPHLLKCGQETIVTVNSNKCHQSAKQPSGVIKITDNLKDLLLALRDEEFHRNLWIDAVCINQDDLVEKKTQVKLMDRIFDTAYATIAYLREPNEHTEMALGYANLLASVKDWPSENVFRKLDLVEAQMQLAGGSRDISHPWLAFTDLFSRDWFRRIWIIQEVLLSRLIIIRCAAYEMKWETLVDACEAVMKHDLYALDHTRGHLQAFLNTERRRQGLMKLRNELGISGEDKVKIDDVIFRNEMSLGLLQMSTRHCNATDPRDKVLALMNICLDQGRNILPPVEYDMTVSELYTRTAQYWFRSQPSRPLQFLTCVNGPSDMDSLPTWVPDWRHAWRTTPLASLQIEGAARKVQAIAKFPDIPSPFVGPLQLTVKGFPLMTIKEVEKVKIPELWETGRHSAMLNEFSDPYPTTAVSYLEAFIRSIEPRVPEDFALENERTFTYWTYEIARQNGRIVLPVSLGHGGGSEEIVVMEIPAEIAAVLNRKGLSGKRPFTQEILYRNLPYHYRIHAPVPQEALIEGRSFFVSTNGFMGLVPQHAISEDEICLFYGCDAPVVLRRQRNKDGNVYRFIGECFVFGLMNGEALNDLPVHLVQDYILE